MEGENTWYEVEDVLKTRTNADGTYSYLVRWKDYAEKAWTHEKDTSIEAIETWDLKTSREDVLKIRSQKQFKCSIPVGAMSKTEGSMSASTETSRDPLKKEKIITHPPGDVHYIDTEDEEKKGKTNVNRTRKRTRKPVQNDQLSSDSGSSSDSSTDSSASCPCCLNSGRRWYPTLGQSVTYIRFKFYYSAFNELINQKFKPSIPLRVNSQLID